MNLRNNVIYQIPTTVSTVNGVYNINQYGTEYILIENNTAHWITTEKVINGLQAPIANRNFQFSNMHLLKVSFPPEINILLSSTISCLAAIRDNPNVYEIHVDVRNMEMQEAINNLRRKGFPIVLQEAKITSTATEDNNLILVYTLATQDYSQARYNHPHLFGLTKCQLALYSNEKTAIKEKNEENDYLDLPCNNHNYRFTRKTHDTYFCFITSREDYENLPSLKADYGKFIYRQVIGSYSVLSIHIKDYQRVLAIKNGGNINNSNNSTIETDVLLELEKELFEDTPELINDEEDIQQIEKSLSQIPEIKEPEAVEPEAVKEYGHALLNQGIFANDSELNKALGDYFKNNTHDHDPFYINQYQGPNSYK